MRSTGFIAAALAAAITVACGGGDRNEAAGDTQNNNNTAATVGTGGEVRSDPAGTAADNNTRDVQNWVNEVAMHNTAEIELGKLAQQRAMNAQVKQYGEMMVRDHTMAGNELKQAVQGQIPMQERVDEKHRELTQRLSGLSGNEFDREYMNAMVDGHNQVKDLLEERAGDANRGANTTASGNTATGAATGSAAAGSAAAGNAAVETAVNQWAAKTLPKVEQHLQQAEQLRDRVRDNRNATN
jgi:putative membrane protein